MGQYKEGQSLEQSVERGLAIQKAPQRFIKSRLQQEAEKKVGERLGERHRTPEQVEIDVLKTQARNELKAGGKSPAMDELQKRGFFTTPKQWLEFIKDAWQTPLQRTLGGLSQLEQAEMTRKYGPPPRPPARQKK